MAAGRPIRNHHPMHRDRITGGHLGLSPPASPQIQPLKKAMPDGIAFFVANFFAEGT